jgi:Ca2+-binding RTX toxin-like protein
MSLSLHQRVLEAIQPVNTLSGPGTGPLPPATTMDVFDGTSGDDTFNGTSGEDTFNMAAGGNDTVNGRRGDDTFKFGNELKGFGDSITGGSGFDTVILNGASYTSFFTVTAVMMTQVEQIELRGGHQYSFIIGSGVQNGRLLTVDASDTVSSFISTSGPADGKLHLIGGDSVEHFQINEGAIATLEMGANNDIVHFSTGRATIDAGADEDTVITHGGLSSNDKIKGGEGTDVLVFAGEETVVLGNQTVRGFESFTFNNLADYDVTTADGTVAAGQNLVVNAGSLGAANSLKFNGKAETDGTFSMTGGEANDVLKGGANNDTISGADGADSLTGGGGSDLLNGGAGHDTMNYANVSDSTGLSHDRLSAFDFEQDKIKLPVAVTDVEFNINNGALNVATFDDDMEAAVTAAKLDEQHAVIFNPSSGDFLSHTFLIVDANEEAGYQAGEDFVFDLIAPANQGEFDANNFI